MSVNCIIFSLYSHENTGASLTNLPGRQETLVPIPGLGRSLGGGNGSPLQSSCLGDLVDGGARWARVHAVAGVRQDLAPVCALGAFLCPLRASSQAHVGCHSALLSRAMFDFAVLCSFLSTYHFSFQDPDTRVLAAMFATKSDSFFCFSAQEMHLILPHSPLSPTTALAS